jgi:hypothetical protein
MTQASAASTIATFFIARGCRMRSVVRRGWVISVAASLAALTAAASSGTQATEGQGTPALFGFGAADGTRELALEQRFDAALDPADLRAWLKTLSAEANHVGAPHDKANAEFVRDLFRRWGWDARIEEFQVLYPTLKQHSLELVAPTRSRSSPRSQARWHRGSGAAHCRSPITWDRDPRACTSRSHPTGA